MGTVVLQGASSGATTLTPTDGVTATLTLPSTSGTLGLSTGSATQSINAQNTFGFKNRIINGAMTIDQRNAGASQSFSYNTGGYTVDRFIVTKVNGWTYGFTTQQVTDAPAGFVKSLKVTQGASADSTSSNTYSYVSQSIEGYNIADLGWGTANAKAITVSFWAKSSLTGTFSFAAYNAGAQSYVATYSLPVANTWTYITITVPGPTSGTFNTDNTSGIMLIWNLGTNFYTTSPSSSWQSGNILSALGATVLWTTANATFNITGVQLEVGTQATSFDFRDYGRELILCQRYFETNYNIGTAPANGVSVTDGYKYGLNTAGQLYLNQIKFQVSKRATPTLTYYRPSQTTTDGQWGVYNGGWATVSGTTTDTSGFVGFSSVTSTSGTTVNVTYLMQGGWIASSEL
jgi:hypothetical protein